MGHWDINGLGPWDVRTGMVIDSTEDNVEYEWPVVLQVDVQKAVEGDRRELRQTWKPFA